MKSPIVHSAMTLSDNVIAYFQPILSADSHAVYAYEVLGRFVDNDGAVKSLGDFFSDVNTTDEDALKIDRLVRRYAMRKYAEENRSENLFINIRLAWLAQYVDNPEMEPTIRWMREFGITPDRIVIEITEEEFNTSDALISVISRYKNAGYRIALDDYGKNASNIDRLAILKPDIIKINGEYIQKSEKSYFYREYLRAVTFFAETLGVEVLYEGIETQRQLDICISSKGRFYQGFLIALPQESMSNAVVNYQVFIDSVGDAYKALHKKNIEADALRNSLDAKLERFLLENPFCQAEVDTAYLKKLCQELPEVMRIYLCNKYGEQISYNFERQSEDIVCHDYRGKNWSWRRYFHKTLEAFGQGKKTFLSKAYRDFTTKERVFTYSHALSDDVFLFADIIRVPLPPVM